MTRGGMIEMCPGTERVDSEADRVTVTGECGGSD